MAKIPSDAVVMIVGSMKSGTTSLFNYLVQHPEICPCMEKEPEFFSEHQEHGIQTSDYLNLWDFDPALHRYALEASTGYTKYPLETGVPERIAAYGLNPRFIYCVRDPIERIISQYQFVNSNPSWGDIDIFSDEAVSLSKYNLQLAQYISIFPRENLLIIDFELLTRQPQNAANQVFEFLGLSPVQLNVNTVFNRTRVPGTLERLVTKRLPWLAPLIPARIKELAKDHFGTRTPAQSFRLSPKERYRLKELLQDDVRAFGENYGFEVSRWGF